MKLRKYDLRNKRSFLIVGIIAIILIVIFSFFIYKFIKIGNVEYKLDSGTVIMDNNNDSMVLKENATLKMKWTGNYYLKFDDSKKEEVLSPNVISYDDGKIYLYGKFFEVRNKDDIVITKDETKIDNISTPRFYKIEDRKYLLVSGSIISSDSQISANDFLLVELDKSGNAKLTNNKVNLKTISKTTLVTSTYEFDINNELLKFGDDTIDLKKIIGTSNQYKEDDSKGSGDGTEDGTGDGTGTGNGGGNETGQTNTGNVVTPDSKGEVVNNKDNKINNDNKPEDTKKPQATVTSVVGVTTSYNNINANYVIYDPYNNYTSTFVEVRNSSGALIKKVNMSKSGNSVILDNLDYNSTYTLLFKYSYTENGEEKYNTYYEETVNTKSPKYYITLNKVSNISKTVSYNVNLDNRAFNEIISGTVPVTINATLRVGDTVIYGNISKEVTEGKVPKFLSGTFALPDNINVGDVVTIKVNSVNINGKTINYNDIEYRFINR